MTATVPADAQTPAPAHIGTISHPERLEAHTAPDLMDLFRTRRRTHKTAWRKRA